MHTNYNVPPRFSSIPPLKVKGKKFSIFLCIGLFGLACYAGGGYTADPYWLMPQPNVSKEKDFPKPGEIFWKEYRLHAIRKGYWELTNSRGELERTIYFDVVISPLHRPEAWREYRVGREGRLVHAGSYNFGIFAYSDTEITVDRTEETLYKLERRDTWPTPQQASRN